MNKSPQCRNCGASLNVSQQKSGVVRCDYCGTDRVVEMGANAIQVEYSRPFTSGLRKFIDEHFTGDEMRELQLCF
jgi:DNA-directed RNA polymerase subunit RPC12/RpoP